MKTFFLVATKENWSRLKNLCPASLKLHSEDTSLLKSVTIVSKFNRHPGYGPAHKIIKLL